MVLLQAEQTYDIYCFVEQKITMDNVKLENALSVVKRDAGSVSYKGYLCQLPVITTQFFYRREVYTNQPRSLELDRRAYNCYAGKIKI